MPAPHDDALPNDRELTSAEAHDSPPSTATGDDLVPLEELEEASSEASLQAAPANEGPASAEHPQTSEPPRSTNAMIERLRAEAEANTDPARKAVLLHEAGELQERVAGDELAAARDYLAAFNEDATFREPLEALLRILERRRSLKNIGRVVENLAEAAETPVERARALRARAADAIEVQNDRGAAIDELEQAVEAWPADEVAWLMLEIEAGVRGDPQARQRALTRRAELTEDPRWSALLRIDLAELRADAGEVDDALDALAELVTAPTDVAWRACAAFERVARAAGRLDREGWLLVQRGEIVLEALDGGPRAGGVPAAMRDRAVALDAVIRAASAFRRAGRLDDEQRAIDRAAEIDPSHPAPTLLTIDALVRAGDREGAAKRARMLLDADSRPDVAPQLWLLIAEVARLADDRAGLIEACERMGAASRALGSPTAIVSRAQLVDLLLDGSDPARLGTLLDAAIIESATADGKARAAVNASLARALIGNDLGGAKATLPQAEDHGIDSKTIARMGRAVAIGLGVALRDTTTDTATAEDAETTVTRLAWRDHATSRLRDEALDLDERADLEMLRAHEALGRGDRSTAATALRGISTSGSHGLLARMSLLAILGDDAGDALLAALADDDDAGGARTVSFAIARALRAARVDEPEVRVAAIDALASVYDDDPLAAFVRVARLLEGRPLQAAEALAALASTLGDPVGRDVLHVAAALIAARVGDLPRAIAWLEGLEIEATTATSALHAVWSRLAARGADDARRVAMEAMAKSLTPVDSMTSAGPWSLFERVVDRLTTSTVDEAEAPTDSLLGALTEAAVGAPVGLGRAAQLLAASWPNEQVSRERRDDAIASLTELGDDARRVMARTRLHKAFEEGDAAATLEASETWLRAGGGAPAAIEALIAAEVAVDSDAEVRARLALAEVLTGRSSALVAAGASLAAHLSGMTAPPIDPASAGDDVELRASLQLASVELSPPGSAAKSRERALHGLADLLVDGAPTLYEMAAWSALARRDHEAARHGFSRAIDGAGAHGPPARSALEGAVETEYLASGRRATKSWALAVERLADRLLEDDDSIAAAALYEQAGNGWWDALADRTRGEKLLARAFDLDARRAAAFDRVFRAMRDRKADDALLALITRRLGVTDDPPEMAKLFWEQARVLRSTGDRDGALSSLEHVTMLEPDHVGALALSAEIYVGRQAYEEAASALDRLSRQPIATPQRLGAGIGAADLYEGKLDRADKSLAVLVALDSAGMSDVAIHERIARAAARAGDWPQATKYLELLMRERASAEGRIEAARLSAAIHRDRLGNAKGSVPALVAILREAPADLDAIEQLLDTRRPVAEVKPTLEKSLAAIRAALDIAPAEGRTARIVGRIAALLGLEDLRHVALGVLDALLKASAEEEHQATIFAERLPTVPAVALDEQGRRRLVDPEDTGALPALFRLLAPTIAEALGPTLDVLGVGRREKIDPRAGSAIRNEIAAWAGAVGIADLDVYQGGRDDRAIQGVPGEIPALVVGASIRAPLAIEDRARLARELFAVTRGTTIALSRDESGVAAVIVAACALGDVTLKAPAYSVLAETQKLLTKAINRKVKKLLPEVAQAVARETAGVDLRSYRAVALRTLDRAAVLATGIAAPALHHVVGGRSGAAKIGTDARAKALLRFLWSDDYLALRKQLGLGVG